MPQLAYWPVLFATAATALPYLLWRAHRQDAATRQRIALFVLSVAVGIAPFLVAVIAAPIVPGTRLPSGARDCRAVPRYGRAGPIVPMTAYSVLVRRVIDVRGLLQRTGRHTGARAVVWAASLLPLLLVAWQLYVHRDISLAKLASQPAFSPALAIGLVGLILDRHAR